MAVLKTCKNCMFSSRAKSDEARCDFLELGIPPEPVLLCFRPSIRALEAEISRLEKALKKCGCKE